MKKLLEKLMKKNSEKIANAKKRIKELVILINYWSKENKCQK